LVERLDKGNPRILVDDSSGSRPDHMQSSVVIMPYMMAAGEEQFVADAIYEAFAHPGHYEAPDIPQGQPAQLAGSWTVEIKYKRGIGQQRFLLKQDGNKLSGSQAGEIYHAEIQGGVHADHVELNSEMEVPGNSISWAFRGVVSGGTLRGKVHMGEYGEATWVAVKS
jgi:hypothetical protein